MISISNLVVIDEGVWSFIKNSVANILGKRKSITISKPNINSVEKIKQGTESYQRLIPKRTVSAKHLGFK